MRLQLSCGVCLLDLRVWSQPQNHAAHVRVLGVAASKPAARRRCVSPKHHAQVPHVTTCMILHKPADYQQPTTALFASSNPDLFVGMTRSADAPNRRLAVALRVWLRAHMLAGSVLLARRGISPPGIKYLVARSVNAILPKVTVDLPCCPSSSFVSTGFCCCVFFITPGVAQDICDSN